MPIEMNRVFRCLPTILLLIATASCHAPVEPTPETHRSAYYVTPDTARVAPAEYRTFAAYRTADTNWRAAKYVWDFDDGSSPLVSRNRNTSYHIYDRPGLYHVAVTLFDSINQEVGHANSVVLVDSFRTAMQLTEHNYTSTTDTTFSFFANCTPFFDAMQFDWDFGDGSGLITTRSALMYHRYTQSGIYPVTVSVRMGSQVLARDSALVTVQLITVSANELYRMASVSSTLSGGLAGRQLFQFTLPLLNAGPNSYHVSGQDFEVRYDNQQHIGSGTSYSDTIQEHVIAGRLSSDGRYLLLVRSQYRDSSYSTANRYQWIDAIRCNYSVDSMRLIFKTRDSIGFESLAGAHCVIDSESTHQKVDPSSSRDCTPIGTISPYITFREFGSSRIVFYNLQ